MALCKYCGQPFAWGQADDRWVPLVPVGEEGDLDRQYQDENGLLRVSHRLVCTQAGGPTVRVAQLAKAVKAEEIIGPERFTIKRRNKRRKPSEVERDLTNP